MPLDEITNRRILIVDDEPQVITALTDVLEEDFEIIGETSVTSALRVLENVRDLSVILCDQRMPKMTGDRLLARARETSDATRLLITGFADLQAVIDAVNDGKIFGYISKPWDSDALKLMIHKAVEYHGLVRDLSEEQALLRNLMASSPDAIFFEDNQQRYLRLNPTACRLLGIDRSEEVIGKSIREVLRQSRAIDVEQENDRILKTGVPVLGSEQHDLHPDEPERWYSITKSALRDERGAVVGLVGIARDITERKRTEQALKESEALLRLILNSTAEAIFGVDKDGKCSFCNRACLEFLGYDAATDLTGRDMHELLHPAHRNADGSCCSPNDCSLKDIHIRGTPEHLEQETLYRQDGSSFVAELWVHPVAGDYTALGSVLTYFDITNQKTLEQQLFQAQKLEAVGQLTGGIAHDFNNLLGVIIGNLEMVSEDLPDGHGTTKRVERALYAALRGADLTSQLLSFSRRQDLQPKEIRIDELIGETVRLLELTLGSSIKVDVQLAPDVGMVRADPAQLQSALINLGVNARDAMPKGGRLTIRASNTWFDGENAEGTSYGNYVTISVSDTGTGIAEDDLQRIFEPFFTTKESGKGTGLGLSMVYGFVKQSGGHTTVKSELGKGTTFNLYLPRISGKGGRSAEVSQRPTAFASIEATVLIVDDNADMRENGASILRMLNCRVVEAQSADEALAILEERADIDVLFTDIMMPGGINGVELAQQARALRADLKILLCSGFPQIVEKGREGLPENASFIRKPYRKTDLSLELQQLLAK